MTDEELNDNTEETPETQSGLQVGLTPWGGIGINVRDASGAMAGHTINDPEEAWILIGHLNALAVMMVQARYSAAIEEQKQMMEILQKPGIYIPGSENGRL